MTLWTGVDSSVPEAVKLANDRAMWQQITGLYDHISHELRRRRSHYVHFFIIHLFVMPKQHIKVHCGTGMSVIVSQWNCLIC